MTNLTIAEKRALEEVFICLDERKKKKIACLKDCLMFYKRNYLERLVRELPLVKTRRS